MPELVEYTWEIGPVMPGAMGPVPIDWPQIAAWQQAHGLELDAFELDAVRDLSACYVEYLQKGRSRSCPAPWTDPDQVNRDAVEAKIREQFAIFSRTRKKR